MNVRAERLDNESIRYIYKTYMKKDFPRSELKPLKSILALTESGRGDGNGFYDGNALAGYAFLIKAPSGRAYLIDYLAVLPSVRGRGYGSACLLALQSILDKRDMYSDKEAVRENEGYIIMAETEDPSFAAREEELQVRRRRIRFYEKNGFFDSRNTCRLFGVEYRILGKSSAAAEKEEIQIRCREELDSIYRTVIPKIVYGSQVIWL